MDTNENQITIIEGPPPTFETVVENWVYGLVDASTVADVALTRLRTFNGAKLVERCYRAWHNQEPIHLVYRNMEGLEEEVPIIAARTVDTEEGNVLMLWVRLTNDDVELEIGFDDDLDNDEDLEA